MKYSSTECHQIKTACLTWLRLEKRCAFIATEVGAYNADVLGVSEKQMIEIEVKVTIEDLRADFRKSKHDYYSKKEIDESRYYETRWYPTHFYFCLPKRLIPQALEYLSTRPSAEKYGVIQFEGMEIIKRPKKMRVNEIDSHVKFTIALRMGSQIIRMMRDWVV